MKRTCSLLFAVALLASACGSSDDDDGSKAGEDGGPVTTTQSADVVATTQSVEATTIQSAFDVTDPTDPQQVVSYDAATPIDPDDWYVSDFNPNSDVFTIEARDESSNGWIVRSADGQAYARVRVKSLNVVLEPESKSVVLSTELWNGAAWAPAQDSPELSYTTSQAFWDLETNSLADSASGWDLAISDARIEYVIEANGGGQGGIGLLSMTSE